jgi:hypothetical protein
VNSRFDRRVVPGSVLDFVRQAQRIAPCHLGGGAALSGAYLSHRMTGDIDLFVHGSKENHRHLVSQLLASDGAEFRIALVRDAGHLVRLGLETADGSCEVDLVHEVVPDIAPEQPTIEGVVVESLEDLRANKLTCILSRSEPRDLVDLYFLDRAGFPPEKDLNLALRKDAGIDPTILAWLLSRFPLEPLPAMLEPLRVVELREFRETLAARLLGAA